MNETYKRLLKEVEKDHQQLGKQKVLIVDGLNTLLEVGQLILQWMITETILEA